MSIFGTGAPKFIYRNGASDIQITGVNTSTEELTLTSGHGLVIGDRVKFITTDTLPSPLAVETYYWVIYVNGNVIKVSTSRNGTAVNLTDTGTGTHFLNPQLTVLIDYWKLLTDEPDPTRLLHESKLTGSRTPVSRGDHWTFEGRINLYKYSDPQSKFEELMFFKNKQMSLWRHRDGNQFKKSDDTDCLFLLDELRPFYLTDTDYKDGLVIKFISLDYIDLTDSSIDIVPQISEINMTESGNV